MSIYCVMHYIILILYDVSVAVSFASACTMCVERERDVMSIYCVNYYIILILYNVSVTVSFTSA